MTQTTRNTNNEADAAEGRNSVDLAKLFQRIEFEDSGADTRQLARGGFEVAIAGRSNAGKSTALNALAGRKALARTSRTPGRTRLVNVFAFDPEKRLVDLPGYGYAKASKSDQKEWTRLIEHYFRLREELIGLVLVVDIRRGLTPLDEQLLEYLAPRLLPVHILLSKSDKLGRGAGMNAMQALKKHSALKNRGVTVQLFSGTSKSGVDEARLRIAELLNL